MIFNFSDKTALVTGGSRGIGKSIITELADLGCTVVYTGTRTTSKPVHKKAKYITLDLSDSKNITPFLNKLANTIDHVDILINNAGINIIDPINQISEKDWRKVIEINLTGPMLLTKEISQQMIKRDNGGKILNISSIFGCVSKEKRDAYSSSKFGLIGLTRASALDLAPYKILVNALCPGFTLTELTKSILSNEERKILSYQIPLGRFADPGEIAQVAVFLCSDLNTYITGQTLVVDGGFLSK
jgi:3-oxoacyl-[acyl-carrier protein] reductase